MNSSIGIEINNGIADLARDRMNVSTDELNQIIKSRISAHLSFISSLPEEKKAKCYQNKNHEFLVKTKQEMDIYISSVSDLTHNSDSVICEYC